MEHSELSKSHSFPDKMDVELDVLGSPMMHRIRRHVDGRDIVAVDERSLGDGAEKLAEELPEPDALRDGIGNTTVLGLGARA
jgi:hypothetical protein